MLLGYRSNDAVITVCQDNSERKVIIRDANKVAEELTGYKSSELINAELSSILPPRIAALLKEYVEFDSDLNDVGMVLAKVQSFAVVNKDGKESGFRLKVVRAESTGDEIIFRLVLQDRVGLRKSEAMRGAISENLKGHEVLDPQTNLPDRYSLGKDIELMSFYNSKGDLRSCFAVLQIDHFDELFSQYGKHLSIAITRHIAFICRQNLRPDDVVGSLGGKRLGILLLDTLPESARMVFNRLRWQIAANPFILPNQTTLGLSASISFAYIGSRVNDKQLIENCEEALNKASTAANALIEVEEGDKRRTVDE